MSKTEDILALADWCDITEEDAGLAGDVNASNYGEASTHLRAHANLLGVVGDVEDFMGSFCKNGLYGKTSKYDGDLAPWARKLGLKLKAAQEIK